ncbi:MAG TPA: hypothetical protein VF995_08950 [Actinomycetota bacterium]
MMESIVAATLLLAVVLVAYLADVLAGRSRLRAAADARRWDHVYQRAQQSRRH